MAEVGNGKLSTSTFNKIVTVLITGGLLATGGGLIRLYGDVRELQSPSSLEKRMDLVDHRVETVEARVETIGMRQAAGAKYIEQLARAQEDIKGIKEDLKDMRAQVQGRHR